MTVMKRTDKLAGLAKETAKKLRLRAMGFKSQIAFTACIASANALRVADMLVTRNRLLDRTVLTCRMTSCVMFPLVSIVALVRAMVRNDNRRHVYMADMWLMLTVVNVVSVAYAIIVRTETALFVGTYMSGTALGCSTSVLMFAYAYMACEKNMPPSGNWTDAIRDFVHRRIKK